jgi:glycosyltransferase involved in cell wall biosynthesis
VKVAYLTNQYPKTSHTFVRREIAGLEEAGLAVERISIRAADEALVDEGDRAERGRTRVLLAHGAIGLLPDTVAVCALRPLRMLRALRRAIAMGWNSHRGLLRHLAYLGEACALLRWASRRGVEHVHAHFSTNPADVALLCRELGGPPFSFTAHGTADLGSAAADSLPVKIERASFAIAVCEDGRRKLLQRTSAGNEHKIHVVRCGVDRAFLAAEPIEVPDAPRLVCVARLSPEKGIDVLLRATAVLKEQGLACELSLLGDGPEREELERLARELDLASCVRFVGWKSGAEVHAHILDSRALVLSSDSEGLPVVIMEALALCRPVIATDVGGISELVVPGDCGWLVPPRSVPELADAMRDALRRPAAELDEMGRRGALRVRAEHDSAAQARRMARLFRESRGGSEVPGNQQDPGLSVLIHVRPNR